ARLSVKRGTSNVKGDSCQSVFGMRAERSGVMLKSAATKHLAEPPCSHGHLGRCFAPLSMTCFCIRRGSKHALMPGFVRHRSCLGHAPAPRSRCHLPAFSPFTFHALRITHLERPLGRAAVQADSEGGEAGGHPRAGAGCRWRRDEAMAPAG